MTDNIAPVGQALVSSHTFWGSVLSAASGSGLTSSILPFVGILLASHGIANPDAIVNAAGVIAGFVWTLYGRVNATQPINGVLKAN